MAGGGWGGECNKPERQKSNIFETDTQINYQLSPKNTFLSTNFVVNKHVQTTYYCS